MARSTDATSTYRGYRKQALDVLWRLLTDPEANSRACRPEGDEDLAVFAGSGDLLQVVQVKDYSAPLALSDFKPESPDGFFARMATRRRDHPNCEVCIASFGLGGPIGTRARRGNSSARLRTQQRRKETEQQERQAHGHRSRNTSRRVKRTGITAG